VAVCCIHLDQILEDVRLVQLEQVWKFLEDNKLDKITHILAGDFNSLSSQEDYSSSVWQQIVQMREDNHWEKPKNKVVTAMETRGCILWYNTVTSGYFRR
jgi:endonuclease/exonuclease/phosphatase family metal-dependent hydrolase